MYICCAGKSAGNAPVWLSPKRTSHYEFYQYFRNMQDSEMPRFLRLFTFLPLEEIDTLFEKHQKYYLSHCAEFKTRVPSYIRIPLHLRAPEDHAMQKALAEEITRLVRGDDGLSIALKYVESMYSLFSLSLNTHTHTLEPQELCLEMSRLILCRPPSF